MSTGVGVLKGVAEDHHRKDQEIGVEEPGDGEEKKRVVGEEKRFLSSLQELFLTFRAEFRAFPIRIHQRIRKEHDTLGISAVSQSVGVT